MNPYESLTNPSLTLWSFHMTGSWLQPSCNGGCCQLQAKVQGGFWDYLAVEVSWWHFASFFMAKIHGINDFHGPKKAI